MIKGVIIFLFTEINTIVVKEKKENRLVCWVQRKHEVSMLERALHSSTRGRVCFRLHLHS